VTSTDPIAPAPTYRLRTWRVASVAGFDARSAYVERFWLPILGPSTTFLLRLLAAALERDGEGARLDAADAARALGLGGRPGRHAPFQRALRRACDFNLLARQPAAEGAALELLVRRVVPAVPARLVERLPEQLRRAHAALERSGTRSLTPDARTHADRLARTLVAIGEQRDAVVDQLVAWRVDPHLALRVASAASARGTRSDQ